MLKWALLACAFLIEACAGFFSVYGLMKLFSGQPIAAGAMGLFLEIGKVVGAMHVYKNWKWLNLGAKIYMPIALVLMVGITSIGAYGFLTNAFQEPLHKIKNYHVEENFLKKKIERITLAIEEDKKRIEDIKSEKSLMREKNANDRKERKEMLNRSFLQGNEGKWINYSAIKSYQKSIETLDSAFKNEEFRLTQRQFEIEMKIGFLEKERDSLMRRLSDLELEFSKTGIDIGPIKFVSEAFGRNPEEIVNFLILILIFIFDPFALTLLASFNDLNKKSVLMLSEKEGESLRNRIGEIEKKIESENGGKPELEIVIKDEIKKLIAEKETEIGKILEKINETKSEINRKIETENEEVKKTVVMIKQEEDKREEKIGERLDDLKESVIRELRDAVNESIKEKEKNEREKEEKLISIVEEKLRIFFESVEKAFKKELDKASKDNRNRTDYDEERISAMFKELEKIKNVAESVNLISYQFREKINSNSDELRQLANKIEKIKEDFDLWKDAMKNEEKARFEFLINKILEMISRVERLRQEIGQKNMDDTNKIKLSQEALELLKKFFEENEKQKSFYHGNQLSIKPR